MAIFVYCVVPQLTAVTVRDDNVRVWLRMPDVIPYRYYYRGCDVVMVIHIHVVKHTYRLSAKARHCTCRSLTVTLPINVAVATF